ncbi:hypothetical protein WA026_019336 [Henosepilachna vigintioctopunctata]|uniref:Uncharacterized protein n=1 Tax=Henosepilachna vigintioctopunctata TaxID=420089 RepID=A0AAW1U9T9_9CUCU
MENVVAASAFVVIAGAYCELKKKRRKRPRWWVRSFLAKRDSEGAYNSLMRDLRLQSGFDNFVRMTAADFELLLNLIGPEITKTRIINYETQVPGTTRRPFPLSGHKSRAHVLSRSRLRHFCPGHLCRDVCQTVSILQLVPGTCAATCRREFCCNGNGALRLR